MRSLTLALLAVLPLAAVAKDNPDASFFHEATRAGHAEIQAGQVAQHKATHPAIKEFAAMMVKDHTAANLRLGEIAGRKGVALPTGPSREQKAMNRQTDEKSGAAFDQEYIQGQIKAHEDTLKLLQTELAHGQDADARAFAAETLPTVQAHLERLKQLASYDATLK